MTRYKKVDNVIIELTSEEIAKIDAEKVKWAEELALVQYQLDRANDYPSIAEQLDYIYHNGVEAWKTDIIDPIKARYPKP